MRKVTGLNSTEKPLFCVSDQFDLIDTSIHINCLEISNPTLVLIFSQPVASSQEMEVIYIYKGLNLRNMHRYMQSIVDNFSGQHVSKVVSFKFDSREALNTITFRSKQKILKNCIKSI